MNDYFNHQYPDISDLQRQAQKRISKFSFDYFEGGCMQELSVTRNRNDVESVLLRRELIKPFHGSNLEVEPCRSSYYLARPSE